MDEVKTKIYTWSKSDFAHANGHSVDQFQKIGTARTYQLPIGISAKKNGLMLNIGSGQGSSLVAGSIKKYIPIGMEAKFEQAQYALRMIRYLGVNGYVVVGDLQDVPFQADLFDLIWSDDIQKMQHDKFLNSVGDLNRILAKSGKVKLEFSNRKGIRKIIKKSEAKMETNCNGSSVREYSLREYEEIFSQHFGKVSTGIHSFAGKVQHLDESDNGINKKLISVLSSFTTFFARTIPGLKNLAERIYVKTQKLAGPQNIRIHHFLKHHWLKQNLNIVYLLQCPISGGPVYLSKDAQFVISDNAGVMYPVIEEIPIMLKRAAIPIEKADSIIAEGQSIATN